MSQSKDFGQAHITPHLSVLIIIYFSIVRAVSERSGHENTPRGGLPECSQSAWHLPLHSYFRHFTLFSPPHSFHTSSPTPTHTLPTLTFQPDALDPSFHCAQCVLSEPWPCLPPVSVMLPSPPGKCQLNLHYHYHPFFEAFLDPEIIFSYSFYWAPSYFIQTSSYSYALTICGHLCRLSLLY